MATGVVRGTCTTGVCLVAVVGRVRIAVHRATCATFADIGLCPGSSMCRQGLIRTRIGSVTEGRQKELKHFATTRAFPHLMMF